LMHLLQKKPKGKRQLERKNSLWPWSADRTSMIPCYSVHIYHLMRKTDITHYGWAIN
jgi:hypothetical protein